MNNRLLAIVLIGIGLLSLATLALSVSVLVSQGPGEAVKDGPTADVEPAGAVDAVGIQRPPVIVPQGERFACELLYVVDGDTVAVRVDGKQRHVRLLRIDTVESDHPDYKRATAALKAMIGGGSLWLEYEGGGFEERDPHGRLLCYLWAGETLVNVAMVRAGWSRFFTRYGGGKYEDHFLDAEAAARKPD